MNLKMTAQIQRLLWQEHCSNSADFMSTDLCKKCRRNPLRAALRCRSRRMFIAPGHHSSTGATEGTEEPSTPASAGQEHNKPLVLEAGKQAPASFKRGGVRAALPPVTPPNPRCALQGPQQLGDGTLEVIALRGCFGVSLIDVIKNTIAFVHPSPHPKASTGVCRFPPGGLSPSRPYRANGS